jgi:hypothetical protein
MLQHSTPKKWSPLHVLVREDIQHPSCLWRGRAWTKLDRCIHWWRDHTSEPTLFSRPLRVHISSDDIEDSASFEAPSDDKLPREETIDRNTLTKLTHILVYECFQFVLYPAAQRQQMENARMSLDYISMSSGKTFWAWWLTCRRKPARTSLEWESVLHLSRSYQGMAQSKTYLLLKELLFPR